MKLGFSYWGYCENYNISEIVETPDGGRFTRPILVKELLKNEVEVIALQKQRETNPLIGLKFSDAFPKIDCLFIEFRWSTYKNDKTHINFIKDKYESDLDRQRELLNFYCGKIPIIIWDTDLKATKDDIVKYKNDVIFAEPALKCINKIALSMLYFTDYNIELFDVREPKRQITYVGSNYERYWGVDKYYYNIGELYRLANIDINFYGSWLTKSIERPEQEEQIKKYSKFINFHKRNKFLEGMKILNNSLCTIHIVKKQYCEVGLITPRFFESLASNTIAFVPEEFLIQPYGDVFKANTLNTFDKINSIGSISKIERENIINDQKNYMQNAYPQTKVENFVKRMIDLFS